MSARVAMEPVPFELQPFGGTAERTGLGLENLLLAGRAGIERGGPSHGGAPRLQLQWQLVGTGEAAPTALQIPPPAPQPRRRDGLWQHTCLEAFVAAADADAYWELNLAPSGDWAVYRFDSYRSGQQSPPLQAPPLTIQARPDGLEVQLHWPLPPELAAAGVLSLGITAVLEQRSGALSYWALHHPGPEADFHRREGFTLLL